MIFFDYPDSAQYATSDQKLWYESEKTYVQRLQKAMDIIKNRASFDIGMIANALHVLSTYYRIGWFVTQDIHFADQCLRESADLGHTQACYDLAKMLLLNGNKEEALTYIEKGLAALDSKIFDSELTGHNQKALVDLLRGFKIKCENNHTNSPKTPPTLAV